MTLANPTPHSARLPVIILVAAAALAVYVSVGVALVLPPGIGADEPTHVEYAAFIATHGRLPDLRVDDVYQAQHPPLYYAFLAAMHGCWQPFRTADTSDNTPAPPRLLRTDEAMPDVFVLPAADATSSPRVSVATYQCWRLPGVALLALVAFIVARSVLASGGNRLLAAACAAAMLCVPQLAITFATMNSDQFAILFSTLAVAALVRRNPVTTGSTYGAGVWLGLAMLSKLTSAAAVVACLVIVFVEGPAHLRARLARIARLLVGPAVIAGWWAIRQVMICGSLDAVWFAAERHPDYIRQVPMDGLAVTDVVAACLRTWAGAVGATGVDVGGIVTTVGTVVLPLIFIGATCAACDKGEPTRQRALAAAFAVGFAVQLGLLLAGNRWFYWTSGRYLEVLLLPAVLAMPAALRAFSARRQLLLVGAFGLMMALGGVITLHAKLVPSFRPAADRWTIPGVVAYVDPGAFLDHERVLQGRPEAEPAWASPRPEGTACIDSDRVTVQLPSLPPELAYSVWVRSHTVQDASCVQDYTATPQVGEAVVIGGACSPDVGDAWLRLPLPRSLTSQGAFTLSARRLYGSFATLSEVLVAAEPFIVRGSRSNGDRVTVDLGMDGDTRDQTGGVSARLRIGSWRSDPQTVVAGTVGLVQLSFLPPADARGASVLELSQPARLWSDVKLAAAATPGVRVIGRRTSPGLRVVDVADALPAGTPIASIYGGVLQPGTWRLHFLDHTATAVPAGRLALRLGDVSIPEAQDATVTVKAAGAAFEVMGQLLKQAGPGCTVDRMQISVVPSWDFALDIKR